MQGEIGMVYKYFAMTGMLVNRVCLITARAEAGRQSVNIPPSCRKKVVRVNLLERRRP